MFPSKICASSCSKRSVSTVLYSFEAIQPAIDLQYDTFGLTQMLLSIVAASVNVIDIH